MIVHRRCSFASYLVAPVFIASRNLVTSFVVLCALNGVWTPQVLSESERTQRGESTLQSKRGSAAEKLCALMRAPIAELGQ